MLQFGEILGSLMRKHGFRAIDLCQELKLSKSHFSKIKNGKMLPGNYGVIERLAEIMRLSGSERDQLSEAYKNAKFGHSYSTIEAAVQRIYGVQEPLRDTEGLLRSYPAPQNGRQISGKEHIVPIMHRIFAEATQGVQLLWNPENEEICEALQRAFSAMAEPVQLEWLLCLGNENGVSAENVNLFSNMVPLVLARPGDVRYCYVNLADFFDQSVFPYLLISEKEVLLIGRDCMDALYLNQAETIDTYLKYFRKQFYGAKPFVRAFDDFELFLNDYTTLLAPITAPCDLYVVERRPCIIHEADPAEIRSHIADLQNRDKVADLYLKFMYDTMTQIRTEYTIFSQAGMREYFEAEEYYEAVPNITRSVSKHLRVKYFQRLIDYSRRSDVLVPGILLTSVFAHTHIHVINIWSSGAVLLVLNFHNQFRILALQEKSIAMSLIAYIQSLWDCGMILPKEDSLAQMEARLREYAAPESPVHQPQDSPSAETRA